MIKYVFVGLGNPDEKYKGTRHNIGKDFLGRFVENQGAAFKKEKELLSEVAFLEFNGEIFVFALPDTYMNESGKAVAKLAKEFNVGAKSFFIIHDELNLPFLKIKLSFNKSAGGHNGVQSVIDYLKIQEFYRLRLGIGKKSGVPRNMESFVLKKFSMLERLEMQKFYDKFERAILACVHDTPSGAMNKIN